MRRKEFHTDKIEDDKQQVYCWIVNVKAISRTRLQPFHSNKITVSFSLLDAAISEPENLILDNCDKFQMISFCIGISIFAENRIQARNEVLNATLMIVEGIDGQLMVEPEIQILSELSPEY